MGRFDDQGISELRRAAIERAIDAEHLNQDGRYRGAMYLRGYGVECHLKAVSLHRLGSLTLRDAETLAVGARSSMSTHDLHTLFARLGSHRLTVRPRRVLKVVFTRITSWKYSPNHASLDGCRKFFDAAAVVERYLRSSIRGSEDVQHT